MVRLIWSPRALGDIQRLHLYLASRNPQAAGRAIKTIRSAVQVLLLQPGLGRPAEEMPLHYREWVIDFGSGGYVALYRYDEDIDTVTVLAVRHQRELGY